MLSKRLTLGALALPLLAATWCGPLRAAELGEVKVNSFLGQQLSADIELVDLTPADLVEIQAKLANPDVFKGAGLGVSPALSGLYISVAKRDNRRFLHLTTLQPVNVEGLHLFLELSSGGRQLIRAATLWLTPEPPAQRAARTAASAAATPAAAPLPALAPAATPVTAIAAATVKPEPAPRNEAGLSAAAERAFAARKQAATSAPVQAVALGEAAKPASITPAIAAAPKPEAKPPKPAKPKPTPVVLSERADVAAPAQACVPAQVDAQIQQCQAMTGKLADLEGKVQRLQQALAPAAPLPSTSPSASASGAASAAHAAATASVASAPPAASAAAASAPVKAAAPEPPPSKPGAKPTKPTKPGVSAELEAKSRTKWIMLALGGLAGFAALGGLVYFLRKRQGAGPLKVWQSFRKKEEPAAAEPTMEEVTAQE